MAEAKQYMLGKDAGLYYGDAGATSIGGMKLVGNVKDLNIDMNSETTDVNVRDSGGWDSKATTFKTCQVTFDMLHRPGDPAFDAIHNAFINNTPLAFAALDAAAGGRGPLGDFVVSNFSEKQGLKEAIVNSVTLSLTKFVEYVK